MQRSGFLVTWVGAGAEGVGVGDADELVELGVTGGSDEPPPVPPPSLGLAVKSATTLVSCIIGTKHPAPAPVQAPDQPVNSEPGSGTARRNAPVPSSMPRAQVGPHANPAGLVTVPEPVPILAMLSWWTNGAKVAPTCTAAPTVT